MVTVTNTGDELTSKEESWLRLDVSGHGQLVFVPVAKLYSMVGVHVQDPYSPHGWDAREREGRRDRVLWSLLMSCMKLYLLRVPLLPAVPGTEPLIHGLCPEKPVKPRLGPLFHIVDSLTVQIKLGNDFHPV